MIECYDFDNLVEKTYGRRYCFQQQDGCKGRGTVFLEVPATEEEALCFDFTATSIPEKVNGEEMGVSFKTWLARDPKQPLKTDDKWDREHGLDLFWRRNFYPALEMVAFDLNQKGLLPSGKYMINIDW